MFKGICLNEDANNFVCSFPDSEMTEEGIRNQARTYLTGQVTRLLFNLNAQRSCFPSKVFQSCWEGVEFHSDGSATFNGQTLNKSMTDTCRHLKDLFERGIDPYVIWLDETRKHSREAWISVRMNDMHDADNPESVMHSRMWREHPEFRATTYDKGTWSGKALDYAHKEVRDYMVAFIQEVLERYDCDGLELDWSRFPVMLSPGNEVRDSIYVTEFMREVKAAVNEAAAKSGHAIRIGIRIPSRPDLARRHGFDLFTWRDEKLFDVAVITNFFGTTDYDMPLELWREILGKDIEMDAGLEILVAGDPSVAPLPSSYDAALGYAVEYLNRGADKIYLFNYMRGFTGLHDDVLLNKLITTGGDEDTACPQFRRHVLSYCTTNYVSTDTQPILPMYFDGAGYRQIRLHVGGKTEGRKARIILGLKPEDGHLALTVRLNGKLCSEAAVPAALPLPPSVTNTLCFAIPDGLLHDGENVIQMIVEDGKSGHITWAEIDVE